MMINRNKVNKIKAKKLTIDLFSLKNKNYGHFYISEMPNFIEDHCRKVS